MLSLKNVLLKVSYNGIEYNGFAYQPTLPTVEWYLFQALFKSKMIQEVKVGRVLENTLDRKYVLTQSQVQAVSSRKYSKCGRTDAGVSAAAQYISLLLPCREKESSFFLYSYDLILNQFLPDNIRILKYILVEDSFSARFSCLWREYEYYFIKGSLNIERMQEASKLLIGTHWFGRLCKKEKRKSKQKREEKLKSSSVHAEKEEAVRTVDSIVFEECNACKKIETKEMTRKKVFVMRITARSFLHNQVRKIFSLLHIIGSGIEVDIESALEKDKEISYTIPLAPAYSLVLSKCAFRDVSLEKMVCSAKLVESQKKIYQREILVSKVSQKIAREGVRTE